MPTYGAEITLDYRTKSNSLTTAHTHKLSHGATLIETNIDSISQWSVTPNPDDSIGSQGTVYFTMQTPAGIFSFSISFVCNNKLQNSCTMTYDAEYFHVAFNLTPEQILTQAPLNVVMVMTEK